MRQVSGGGGTRGSWAWRGAGSLEPARRGCSPPPGQIQGLAWRRRGRSVAAAPTWGAWRGGSRSRRACKANLGSHAHCKLTLDGSHRQQQGKEDREQLGHCAECVTRAPACVIKQQVKELQNAAHRAALGLKRGPANAVASNFPPAVGGSPPAISCRFAPSCRLPPPPRAPQLAPQDLPSAEFVPIECRRGAPPLNVPNRRPRLPPAPARGGGGAVQLRPPPQARGKGTAHAV